MFAELGGEMDEKSRLDQLAAQEDELYAQMQAAHQESTRTIFDAIYDRVTAEYTQVYHRYVEVLRATNDPAVRLEALKRTVFLRWYIFTEPDWISGVGMPMPADAAIVFDALNELIGHCQLDEEFDWMLAWYADYGWDFALQPLEEEGGPRPNMSTFLREKKVLSEDVSSDYRAIPSYVDPGTLTGRGQLSAYWLHMTNPR